MNLDSQGQWITVYVLIETEYEGVIDVATVKLDDTIQSDWGEIQEDGRLMIKFVRTAVIDLIPEDVNEGTLMVSGEFTNGMRFSGWDTIRIVNNG